MHKKHFLLRVSILACIFILTSALHFSFSYSFNKEKGGGAKIEIYGYTGCEYFNKAVKMAKQLPKDNIVKIEASHFFFWNNTVENLQRKTKKELHRYSPIIFINDKFIGNTRKFKKWIRSHIKNRFTFGPFM